VDIAVIPPVAAAEMRALQAVLQQTGLRGPNARGYESAWRRSALREAVERGELENAYALSPRSTRGATRA
jgi:hypothetical protein